MDTAEKKEEQKMLEELLQQESTEAQRKEWKQQIERQIENIYVPLDREGNERIRMILSSPILGIYVDRKGDAICTYPVPDDDDEYYKHLSYSIELDKNDPDDLISVKPGIIAVVVYLKGDKMILDFYE